LIPASTGTYVVSVSLVGDTGTFQIVVGGQPVAPDIPAGGGSGPTTVSRILSVTGGDTITIVNNSGLVVSLSAGTEIRIFRIA
jgi:hypothetical protein